MDLLAGPRQAITNLVVVHVLLNVCTAYPWKTTSEWNTAKQPAIVSKQDLHKLQMYFNIKEY